MSHLRSHLGKSFDKTRDAELDFKLLHSVVEEFV